MGFQEWASKNRTNVAVSSRSYLMGEKLVVGGKRVPLAGAVARFESGPPLDSRRTATRVATGAVLLGPVGAVLGGMAKKDASKLHIVVEAPNGTVHSDETHVRCEKQARRLVENINIVSARLAPASLVASAHAAPLIPVAPTAPAAPAVPTVTADVVRHLRAVPANR